MLSACHFLPAIQGTALRTCDCLLSPCLPLQCRSYGCLLLLAAACCWWLLLLLLLLLLPPTLQPALPSSALLGTMPWTRATSKRSPAALRSHAVLPLAATTACVLATCGPTTCTPLTHTTSGAGSSKGGLTSNKPPTHPLQLKGGRGQPMASWLPSVSAWDHPPFPTAALTWSARMSWLV